MYKNGLKYNKMYRNGIAYNKGYKNGVKNFGENIPTDYLLRYDLDGNFLDKGPSALHGIAGGTNNLPTFTTGRKGTDQCAVFNGSRSFKTPSGVTYGSNQLTISFWMKTSQTSVAIIMESSPDGNNNFNIWHVNVNDTWSTNKIGVASKETSFNLRPTSDNVNTNQWFHVVATINRNLNGVEEIKIYLNTIDKTGSSSTLTDNNNTFSPQILFIGQRNGSTLGFNGSVQQIKIYKRILTASEITALYNE